MINLDTLNCQSVFVLLTCKSLASEGSTGLRHWIILLILFGDDGSGCATPKGGGGTTGVSVVYEKPDEDAALLAKAQLLFSGLSFLQSAKIITALWLHSLHSKCGEVGVIERTRI